MEFTLKEWSESDYNRLINYIKDISDESYRSFHSKLVKNKENILGVRMPQLRRIAKEINKGNWKSYLKVCKKDYYEETMLRGIVIGLARVEYDEFIKNVDGFIDDIDNWAVCDSFCGGLNLINKYKDNFFNHACEYTTSLNAWKARVGLVIFLNFYISDKYLHKVIEVCDNIKNENYYVRMAQAWLISYVYIEFPKQCIQYLKSSSLDDWTYNKTLQKIVESTRVSNEEKKVIKSMKRK